jgi:hypothetical protein
MEPTTAMHSGNDSYVNNNININNNNNNNDNSNIDSLPSFITGAHGGISQEGVNVPETDIVWTSLEKIHAVSGSTGDEDSLSGRARQSVFRRSNDNLIAAESSGSHETRVNNESRRTTEVGLGCGQVVVELEQKLNDAVAQSDEMQHRIAELCRENENLRKLLGGAQPGSVVGSAFIPHQTAEVPECENRLQEHCLPNSVTRDPISKGSAAELGEPTNIGSDRGKPVSAPTEALISRTRSEDAIERTEMVSETAGPSGFPVNGATNSSVCNKHSNELINRAAVAFDMYDKLKTAMEQLQGRFSQAMQQNASLCDEKDQLEHIVEQLRTETDTIGEYITIYQHQRKVTRDRLREKQAYIERISHEKEEVQRKLLELQELVVNLLHERGLLHSYQTSGRSSPRVGKMQLQRSGSAESQHSGTQQILGGSGAFEEAITVESMTSFETSGAESNLMVEEPPIPRPLSPRITKPHYLEERVRELSETVVDEVTGVAVLMDGSSGGSSVVLGAERGSQYPAQEDITDDCSIGSSDPGVHLHHSLASEDQQSRSGSSSPVETNQSSGEHSPGISRCRSQNSTACSRFATTETTADVPDGDGRRASGQSLRLGAPFAKENVPLRGIRGRHRSDQCRPHSHDHPQVQDLVSAPNATNAPFVGGVGFGAGGSATTQRILELLSEIRGNQDGSLGSRAGSSKSVHCRYCTGQLQIV